MCICAGALVYDIFRNNVAMEQLANMREREREREGVLDNAVNFSSWTVKKCCSVNLLPDF